MTSHAKLLENLGGGSAVADAARARGFALDRNRVYRWLHDKKIPWRWRPLVAEIATARGVALPDGFLMPPVVHDDADNVDPAHSPALPAKGLLNRNGDEEATNATGEAA